MLESCRDAHLACFQTQCSLHTAESRYESDVEQAHMRRRRVIDSLEANHLTSLSRALMMLNSFHQAQFLRQRICTKNQRTMLQCKRNHHRRMHTLKITQSSECHSLACYGRTTLRGEQTYFAWITLYNEIHAIHRGTHPQEDYQKC